MSATQFVIRITNKRGADTFVRQGATTAGALSIFHSPKHAQRTLEMLEPGLGDGARAAVIPLGQVPRGIHREAPQPKPKAKSAQRKKR